MSDVGFNYDNFNEFDETNRVGIGAFASVYCITRKDGKEFAVKCLRSKSDKDKVEFLNEIDMLKKIAVHDADRIVPYYGHDEKEDNVYIFMRYMEKGSIYKMLQDRGKPFTEAETKRYTQHILQGLKFLHDNKILHRDIKGKNVLVDANNNAALSDFGFSVKVLGNMTTLRSSCGTFYYMSPEVLNADVDKSGRRADVWSAGCTVIEMLTMHPPWIQRSQRDAIQRIKSCPNRPEVTMELPTGAKIFLSLIFVEKERRCYVDELLSHPWLQTSQ